MWLYIYWRLALSRRIKLELVTDEPGILEDAGCNRMLSRSGMQVPLESFIASGSHALLPQPGGGHVTLASGRGDGSRECTSFTVRMLLSKLKLALGSFPTILSHDPADILLHNWNLGRPVALDISVVSPLNPSTLAEAGATFDAVLEATESRKHQANDEKCSALGWVSTPLAVDSYGAWGKEASLFFAQVAARLAIHKSLPKSQASFDLFSNLSICLIRANARAILRRV
eukprot:Em0002g1921a